MRRLVRETALSVDDLIYPIFVCPGTNNTEAVATMPGITRLSVDLLPAEVERLEALGVPAVAVFPVTPSELKTADGKEAYNPDGLAQQAIRTIKQSATNIGVLADVALDPYTSHGHDGVLNETGEIVSIPGFRRPTVFEPRKWRRNEKFVPPNRRRRHEAGARQSGFTP